MNIVRKATARIAGELLYGLDEKRLGRALEKALTKLVENRFWVYAHCKLDAEEREYMGNPDPQKETVLVQREKTLDVGLNGGDEYQLQWFYAQRLVPALRKLVPGFEYDPVVLSQDDGFRESLQAAGVVVEHTVVPDVDYETTGQAATMTIEAEAVPITVQFKAGFTSASVALSYELVGFDEREWWLRVFPQLERD